MVRSAGPGQQQFVCQLSDGCVPTLPIITTSKGAQFASVVKNLTGGERPMFVQGFGYGGSYRFAYGGFGSDGTINGILTQKVLDTQALRYTIDGDAAATAALNAAAQKISAHPDANRLRRDGLRWIPQVNGAFKVPVLSIHTLGTCMYRSPCSKAMPDV